MHETCHRVRTLKERVEILVSACFYFEYLQVFDAKFTVFGAGL